MHAEVEQIIYHGHTTQRVWDELAHRSRETRRKIVLQCPVCDAELHPTDTTHLQCLSCDAPVSIYQHREMTDTADTRIIYAEANAHRRAVLTLDLQCLSCGLPLQADETCPSTCEIQTYLIFEHEDGDFYIKRWVNRLNVPRDTPFIPIRPLPDTDKNGTHAQDATQNDTENRPMKQTVNQPQNQPNLTHAFDNIPDENPNRHTDVKGQIVAYLTDAPENTAGTREMTTAIGCSPQGFKKAKDKLIEHGQIRQIKRGVYQLINP